MIEPQKEDAKKGYNIHPLALSKHHYIALLQVCGELKISVNYAYLYMANEGLKKYLAPEIYEHYKKRYGVSLLDKTEIEKIEQTEKPRILDFKIFYHNWKKYDLERQKGLYEQAMTNPIVPYAIGIIETYEKENNKKGVIVNV